MKIAAFQQDRDIIVGIVDPDGTVRSAGEINAFWQAPQAALATANGESVGRFDDLQQRPAVPRTARVICAGLNYRLHAQETGSPIPTVPIIFSRWANTLATDGEPVPQIGEKFDWEVELGAVIGRRMFRVNAEQAAAGIFGYVAFNDLSARDYQMETPQWALGKNTDASGPMSPIVTPDETGDPIKGLRITTRVNGETVQDSTTADMIFSVPQLIAHVSKAMTLEPGDLIVTGTPSGVGMATGRFLKPGDEVEVEIERIGRVRTPIVETPPAIA